MFRTIQASLVLAALVTVAPQASDQWATQTIPLRPGWNSVYLEVQPEPRECDVLFAGIPVESVRAWNRRSSSVQFIQDPATLNLQQPDWLIYLPPNHRPAAETSLFTLDGGRTYLIKLPDSATPVNWVLQGRPTVRKTDWLTGSRTPDIGVSKMSAVFMAALGSRKPGACWSPGKPLFFG